jgi:hypothetical protein
MVSFIWVSLRDLGEPLRVGGEPRCKYTQYRHAEETENSNWDTTYNLQLFWSAALMVHRRVKFGERSVVDRPASVCRRETNHAAFSRIDAATL